MKNSSVFYKGFYKFLRFFLIFVSFFCICEIGFSIDFRWASYDSEGWSGDWSDVYVDSGDTKTKHWEYYSEILPNLLGWSKCGGDFPGYGSVTDPDVYFTAENESYATLTADCTNELKNLFISDRKKSNEVFGSEKVTINLAGFELKTKNLVLGNSSFGTGDSVNFALTDGGTLMVSVAATFAAGCTYNIKIGANTVLDVAALPANVSGATINFSGAGTLKLGKATFSNCTVNFELGKIEVSGATEISDSATVNFNNVSSVSFSEELKNSGAVNFSACPAVEFTVGFANSGKVGFSGATATSVSGKITNSGTITLNQTAKTEFSGGFENQASGSLICNETAETIFAGDFINSGKVTINGSSARTFSGNFANSGCLSICDSSKVVFQTVFSNSESGTVELLGKASSSVRFPADFDNKGTVFSSGLCLVVFSADITDSGTWIYSGGTVKNDGISYNILELNGTIVIPGDLTANEINTGNKIVLNEATTINATSVNLLQNTTFDLNSHKLVFGTEEKKCLVNSSSKKDIAFLGAGTGSEVNFYSANIGQDSSYIGNFYSESPVEFYCDVYANSVVVKSDVKIHSEKIFTSIGQEYFSSVTVSSAKTGIKANNGAISFKGNAIFEAESAVFASGAVSFGGTLTSKAGLLSIEGLETTFSGTFSSVAAEISARSGSVYFNDAVKFAGKTSVNALKGDVSFKAMLTASDNLSVNASKVIFFRDLTVSSGLVSLLANTIFSGDSTVSLENGTFSVGSESNPKTTTVSAGASARFQNISAATFSGKIENSGNLSFSDCLVAKISGDLQNNKELEFSGATATSVSGKITNSGTITLNQTAKTEFSGGFENQASGSLICNETAETIFAGDFTNSGKVTINGGATRTFASFTNNQNGVISVNGTSNVSFDKFRNNNSSKLSVNDSAKIVFQTVFSNSESGTIELLGNASSVSFPASSDNTTFENKGTICSSGLCAVLFSADVTDSGTWIYSGGTVKNDGISYNILELNGTIVIPGDLTAEEIIIKTESLNIQGEIKSSLIEVNTENKIVLDKNATINATSVNLLQSTTFDVNGKNLVFSAENQKSSIISENKKNLVILGSASDDKTIFYSSLGTATSPLGKISSKVEISFNADVYSESIEANSAAEISSAAITTSGGQGYNSTVKITGTQAKLVSENGGISFVGTVDISAETTISANDSVRFEGIFAATSAVSVEAKSVVFGAEVKTEARLDVSAIDGDVRFLSVVSGSSYGFSVTAANVQFDSDLVASGAVLLVAEAYFSGNAKDKVKIEAEKISVGSENIEKNLYISALKDENSAKKVEWNAPLNVSGSLLLLNADLSFGKAPSGGSPDISVSNDIVFLNGNSSSMYNDDILAKFEWRSGAKNIFKYQGTVLFPKNFPDGTEISSEKFISSLSGLGGITISAGKNFYCNGVNLEGDSGWNLKAGDNESSENFAVVYNSSIKNCSYSSSGNGISYFAAAEATDGGGNSENVCFGHPEISLARTIYDDVVEISFKDSISGKSLKIENSNNEIWKTFANSSKFLTYENDGKKISFAGTYIDAECTKSTENKGDLEKFYLKAPETWNTDATGGTSGVAQSTDMNGNHRAAIPYLNIVRAVSDDFSGLFDEHKNRIANYDGEKRFVDVEDSCPPVLVAVRTGQELHQELPENQNPYDSHNFLEFQYSEEIFADKSDSSALNVQSSEKFGGMKNLSSESGFVVSGLVQFEWGKISLGSESGLSAEKLNSIYRNFAVSTSEGALPQTHRFRISLAGYQSQSAAENPSGFPYWPGYIDSENTEIPSGKIVQLPFDDANSENSTDSDFNDFIKDAKGNSLLVKSRKNHELQTLSVISDSTKDSFETDWNNSVYGLWDLSAPVFAFYHSLRSNARRIYETCEILGACEASDTVLNRIEFHVFDNSEEFFNDLGAEWYSHFGWGKDKKTLFAEDSYASDIFGGSRPFGNSSGASAKTSGGIRYSTLYNKSSYFKYGIDSDSPAEEFKDSAIKSGASSSLFLSQIRKPREISSNDSLYFSIFLKDGTNLPLKTNFSIKFDEKACVTDLAGNLMKSAVVKSVDLIPPRFNMTSAKISGNKLYIVFNKKISLVPVELENSDGTTESFGIADSLRFIKIPENPHKFDEDEDVVSDLYIEKGIPPQETYSSDTFTGLIFTLNRNVTLEDVKNYYIQCFSPGSGKFVDPFTGISDVKVTSVTDINGIYMANGEAHALSDFAVDVVNPVYAYDDRFMEENFGFSASAAAQSNLSVREWNEDQQKDGTLLTEHNLFVVTSQDSGNSEDAESLPEKIIMYYDKSPDSDSVSKEYNKNLEQNLRVWIPSLVPVDTSGSSTERISSLTALASATNSNNLFAAGEVSKNIAKFTLDWETMEKNGYSSGNQVSFLFGLAEPDGSPVKICHAPSYDEITGVYRLEHQPLFALRLKNSNDPVSLDLWSFRLKSAVLQRGNVTIFNNVIDVNKAEMSVVRVNMPSEGRLDVIVMTLDGNIIRYLQHGTASAGEHNYSWNGTSKSGKKVARGLYFVRVFGNGIDETRKIMVVKN